jgi:hypothetical protein
VAPWNGKDESGKLHEKGKLKYETVWGSFALMGILPCNIWR